MVIFYCPEDEFVKKILVPSYLLITYRIMLEYTDDPKLCRWIYDTIHCVYRNGCLKIAENVEPIRNVLKVAMNFSKFTLDEEREAIHLFHRVRSEIERRLS